MPPQPEIEKLEKKLEKVSISDHRSQSRPKHHHRHSKTRKPPESPEVKSGQTENSKPKQRGRSRGPKPKKAKNRKSHQTNIRIEDIYSKTIPLKVAQELLEINKARKKLLESKNNQIYPSAQSNTSAARIT